MPGEHPDHVAVLGNHLSAGEPQVVLWRVGPDPPGAVAGGEDVLHREEPRVEGGDVEVLDQVSREDVPGASREQRVGRGQNVRREREVVVRRGNGLEAELAVLDTA